MLKIPNSPLDKRQLIEAAERETVEAARERRRVVDRILLAYGYKPWKRIDRRNRPLRTKRAWVSCRARFREMEIVRLRLRDGATFREIGRHLGISYVAAWKRFEWAMEDFRLENEYRAECLSEIQGKLAQMDLLEPRIAHLSPKERRRTLIGLGLIPEKSPFR